MGIESGLQRSAPMFGVQPSRHRDEIRLVPSTQPKRARHLEATQVWQADFDEGQVGVEATGEIQRSGTGGSPVTVMPHPREQCAGYFGMIAIIVDDKDAHSCRDLAIISHGAQPGVELAHLHHEAGPAGVGLNS